MGWAAEGTVESDRSHSQLCDLRKGICHSEPLLPPGHIDPQHLSQTAFVCCLMCSPNDRFSSWRVDTLLFYFLYRRSLRIQGPATV